MKSILAIAVAVIFFSCTPKGFVNMSKQVENKCINKKRKWTGKSFHSLRVRLYNQGKLNFINSNFDTLFILETYEIESGIYMGRIWNKKDALNYTYNKNSFSFDQQKLFTAYTIQLVQSWDTLAIRSEERINANNLPEKNINGVKVSIVNQKVKVECIKFKEFFKLERDR